MGENEPWANSPEALAFNKRNAASNPSAEEIGIATMTKLAEDWAREKLRADCLEAALTELRAETVEVLEPWKRVCEWFAAHRGERDTDETVVNSYQRDKQTDDWLQITLGDLRRASALHDKLKPKAET